MRIRKAFEKNLKIIVLKIHKNSQNKFKSIAIRYFLACDSYKFSYKFL